MAGPLWWVQRAGRIFFYGIWGVITCVAVLIGIGNIVDASEPTYWGTFTEQHCDETPRYGCRSVGTWASDDGTIRLHDVYLDGTPDADGTAEAQYQPDGAMSDADNNIVHTSLGVSTEPVLPWLLAAFGIGTMACWSMKWRGTWKHVSRDSPEHAKALVE